MKKTSDGFTYAVREGDSKRPGVNRRGREVSFTVAVPDEKPCSLLLYRIGEEEPEAVLPMMPKKGYGDLRSLVIEGLPIRKYAYQYEIDGQIVTDPYARRITGREQWGQLPAQNAVRGLVTDGTYDWEGDAPLQLPWQEIVAYAAHVRGFTKDPSSKVRHRGTFRGLMEKIPYLKELGINQLQLMPIYEFAEVQEESIYRRPLRLEEESQSLPINYWGYGDGFYFAPKASYASSSDPVRECKDLVKELHKNGIELILEFYFPKSVRMAMALDCIRYWVLEYHIDGVCVNRDAAPVEALAQEPLLSHTKILTESFELDTIYEERQNPRFRNLAEKNDGFMLDARRFLKGDEGASSSFVWRARRNPPRTGVLNYLAGHNGFTLMDALSYDAKHNEANGEDNRDGTDYNYSWNCGEEGPSRKKKILALRARQLRNAYVLLLLSQGTPMIYGGDERGNSQEGNNNAWCQDNPLSWVNWKTGAAFAFLPEYVRALIAFRRRHPIFWQDQELRQTDYLSCGYPDLSYHGRRAWFGDFENYSRSVGVLYAGEYVERNSSGEKRDDFFYVAYNMHWIPHEFALPDLPAGRRWQIALSTDPEGLEGIYPEGEEPLLSRQKTVEIPGRTILILRGAAIRG